MIVNRLLDHIFVKKYIISRLIYEKQIDLKLNFEFFFFCLIIYM